MQRSHLPDWYKVQLAYAQRWPLKGPDLERQADADKQLGRIALVYGEDVAKRLRDAATALYREALDNDAPIPPERFVADVLKRSGVTLSEDQ